MQRIAAHFGNMVAIASFAMMLSVEMLHSPLHHCCDDQNSCENSGETCPFHSHCHSHQHADGPTHSHSHQHNETSGCPSNQESPLPHGCQICEFLAQAITSVELPVVVEGEEPVNRLIVEVYIFSEVTILSGPYVRGPPVSVVA